MNKIGIIYCLTSPSNKKYIGQTFRKLDKRLFEHETREDCKSIHNAVKKYGIDKFHIEILYECQYDKEILDDMEIKFIKDMNTLSPNGYNIRTGGSSGLHCESSRELMRLSKLGANNPNFGKPRTPETKLKISQSRIGEKHHFYGKQLTLEHKLELSKSHKKDDLPMYLIRVKPRPEHYCSSGFAVINHPILKNKYYTSKKYSDDEKYKMALEYLNSSQINQ